MHLHTKELRPAMFELTKNKIRLLKLFYSHPGEAFYMQEIGRMLGKKPGVFQRTINGLEKEGVLVSEYKANARFFRVNTKSPVYAQLRELVMKYEKLFKKGLGILVLCGIASWLACAPAQAEQKEETAPRQAMTIEAAIRTAFDNNKNILIQEKEVDASRAQILDARSVFMPQVNVEGGYKHAGSVPKATAALSGKKDYGVYVGYENDNQWGVAVDQSIYTGGANTANLRQQQLNLKVQEETLRALKLDAAFETKRLFFGLLLAYEIARIAQDLLDQAAAHYEDVKKKYKEGTASRFDLLQSKVQVTKVMPELIRAKNAIRLSMADLNKELGLGVYDPLMVDGKLVYQPIAITEEAFLAKAYIHRPEMIVKLLGIDIAKWSIKAAHAGYRPQVNLSADYYYRSDDYSDMFNQRHNNWDVGVSVRVPIFDGFSSLAKVREAKARYAQSQLSQEDVSDQTALLIRQDCLNLRESQAIVDSQKDNVAEAKEALEIAIVSYDNGVGTNLDVLDAQVSLAQIEQTLAEGVYDYMMAQAALDRDTGHLPAEEKISEDKKPAAPVAAPPEAGKK
ncbi:MAG: TolC family protein [Candidatus Omnitrophica bacterium]|nr:TolC family protein [Candidatus Omnitrophota bacterium]